MELITEVPIAFSSLCLLLGLVYSAILYYRNKINNEFSKSLIVFLSISRAVVVSFIAFFLLTPLLKTLVNEKESPIVLMAIDESESISYKMDSLTLVKINERLKKVKEELSDKFQVDEVKFGADVSTTKPEAKYTNFSNLYNYIENTYTNRNLSSVIVVSDGIYNQGANPLYVLNKAMVPVYTIGIGDTTIYKDVGIKRIDNNNIAYLGNKFPVEISVIADKCAGEMLHLKLLKGGKELQQKSIEIVNNKQFEKIKFLIEADLPGKQKFTVDIEQLSNEKILVNNKLDFYVDIIENKQNILILADAPHPDIGAVRRSLSSNNNYTLAVDYFNKFKGSINDYNLVVLHQIGTASKVQSKKIIDEIKNAKIPVLYLLNGNSDNQLFNEINGVISLTTQGNKTAISIPALNDNFNLFSLSNETKSFINKFPPLVLALSTSYLPKTSVQYLINQKVGSVTTQNPLIAFGNNEFTKNGVVFGEGLWKWRIFNFQQKGNHDAFDELMQKTVQYLAAKDDKSKFKIIAASEFYENESVSFKAELYDDSYQLITDSEISIDLTNENNDVYSYKFIPLGNVYMLDAGILMPGKYNYEAKVDRNGKQYIKKGEFTVKSIVVEALNTIADFSLLKQISTKTNGKFYSSEEIESLKDEISNKNNVATITYSYEKLSDLINLKWLFFLILTLLSLEWFIRKRNGAY